MLHSLRQVLADMETSRTEPIKSDVGDRASNSSTH